ncbi:heterokaryon incompatibility protein-domain-containing protein [Fusarium oxysporum f. sp. albedinis]|nr:heterokaryon incompatibility protein-domain-containing protein [Fusarium oxysporum f. sp. albedinis]
MPILKDIFQSQPSAFLGEMFSYGKSQLKADQLRLLLVLPNSCEQDHTNVYCNLVRLDLSATETLKPPRHPFIALSYVWGDTSPQKIIYINGKKKEIGPRLHEALLHIRDKLAPVALWVDAICINQDDVSEKQREVLKMKRIYTECQAVLYWLGIPENAPSFHAQWGPESAEIFGEFGQVYDELCERGEEARYNPFRAWESLYKDQDPHLLFRLNEALATMLFLPFWRRVWIAQEFVLARDGVFMWGTHTFNMKVLEALAQLQDRVQPRSRYEIDFGQSSQAYTITLGAIAMRSKRVSLLEALANTRYRLATWSHDYIYGMLGIAAAPGILPNYHKSKKEVFLEGFEIVISQETNLDVLSMCDRGWAKCSDPGSQPDADDWPTWLPDWSFDTLKGNESRFEIPVRSLLFDLQEYDPISFSACGYTTRVVSVLENRKHVSIRGVDFDTVAQTVGGVNDSWREIVKDLWNQYMLHPMYDSLKYMKAVCMKTSQYGRNQVPAKEEFDRIFSEASNQGRMPQRSVNQDSHLFRSEDDDLITNHDFKYEAGRGGPVHLMTNPSMYFITQRGLLGRGPVSTRPGDKVCVLFGGRVPFLLRPTETNLLQLVGETYIYGIMQGAAITVTQHQEKDFILC